MRRRLMLGAFYLLLVVVAGLTIPFAITFGRQLTDELGARVEREAFATATVFEDMLEAGEAAGSQRIAERLSLRIGGRVLLTDARGILLADSLDPPGPVPPSYATRPEIAEALRGRPTREVRHSETLGRDLLVSAVPVRSGGEVLGAVRISYPMDDVRASIRRSYWFLAGIGLVTILVGLALAGWLAHWLSRPVKAAAATAREIAAGRLDARVPEGGPPEVQELAADMNRMTDRLTDLMRANREFAANASHQMRTPLAALRLSLEEAVEGPAPREEARHALQEADRLKIIVESLLALGRAPEPSRGTVDAVELAERLVEERFGGPPEVRVSGAGIVRADPERLRQVLVNLIGNARRFAGDRIRVEVTEAGDRVTIAVEDDGPGVPVDERDRIFDRFYRGRGPGGDGAGLGLAVARELVQADGATLDLAHGSEGARFEVTYPVDLPAEERGGMP